MKGFRPGGAKLVLPGGRSPLTYVCYSASLFASNLTNKRAILSGTTEGANPFTGDGARATIIRPRTIGVLLGAGF